MWLFAQDPQPPAQSAYDWMRDYVEQIEDQHASGKTMDIRADRSVIRGWSRHDIARSSPDLSVRVLNQTSPPLLRRGLINFLLRSQGNDHHTGFYMMSQVTDDSSMKQVGNT